MALLKEFIVNCFLKLLTLLSCTFKVTCVTVSDDQEIDEEEEERESRDSTDSEFDGESDESNTDQNTAKGRLTRAATPKTAAASVFDFDNENGENLTPFHPHGSRDYFAFPSRRNGARPNVYIDVSSKKMESKGYKTTLCYKCSRIVNQRYDRNHECVSQNLYCFINDIR